MTDALAQTIQHLADFLAVLDLTTASGAGQTLEDELAKANNRLTELKHNISWESKRNYALLHDLRLIDKRIALLVTHKSTELEADISNNSHNMSEASASGRKGEINDERLKEQYGHFLYALQNNPMYLAKLAHTTVPDNVNKLMHIIMFTIYGNQYVSREEHLLLSMFEFALELEFERARESQTVLRGNTAVSRMMATYTRRGPGQKYLRDLIEETVQRIVHDPEINFEIDPVFVAEEVSKREGLKSSSLPHINNTTTTTTTTTSTTTTTTTAAAAAAAAATLPGASGSTFAVHPSTSQPAVGSHSNASNSTRTRIASVSDSTMMTTAATPLSISPPPPSSSIVASSDDDLSNDVIRSSSLDTSAIQHSQISLVDELPSFPPQSDRHHSDSAATSHPSSSSSRRPASFSDVTWVQTTIDARLITFNAMLEEFLTRLISTLDTVPFGIRYLCKKIKLLMEQNFPESPAEQVTSLIGGFFLLRYVNPAIMTPDDQSSLNSNPRGKRNLILFAKALQMLANRSAFLKVPHMAALAFFSEDNQRRMEHFLLDLCKVDDISDALEKDKYNAAYGREKIIHITLNEIYSLHEMFVTHCDEVIEVNDPFHDLVVQMGPAPELVSRDEDCVVSLVLGRWSGGQVPMGGKLGDSFHLHSSLSYEEVCVVDIASLSLRILRLLCSKIDQIPSTLEELLDIASNETLGASADAHRVREILQELEGTGALVEGGRRVIFDLVLTRFASLGTNIASVNEELSQLTKVHSVIVESNATLKTQLDVYQQYLDNVRQSVGPARASLLKRIGGLWRQVSSASTVITSGKVYYPALEKENMIVCHRIPEARRNGVYLIFSSPAASSYIASLHYRGRECAIITHEFCLDDLLDMQKHGSDARLELGDYVHLDAVKTLAYLKCVLKR